MNDDDDFSVILTPAFSSGESDEEQKQEFMNLENKRSHIKQLWHKLLIKTIGGVTIINRFQELNDNLTMFGAQNKIDLDIEEEIIPLPFILLPENKFKMLWNFITMILLLYTASFVPYRTAFIDDSPSSLATLDWVIDSLFMFDILVNFISAYEDRDKNIEVRLKMITIEYIKSWFFFDLAAVMPF